MFHDIVKSMCGTCCATAVIVCGVSIGMEKDANIVKDSGIKMPTIPYSQNEGVNLAAYHQRMSDPTVGYKYFMPRSDSEISGLHSIWKAGKVLPYGCLSSEEVLWGEVMSIINGELVSRCLDGKLDLIEDFLENFGKFIDTVDGFEDKAFIKPLVSPFDGLPNTLKLFAVIISDEIKENCLLSWEFCHVTRVTSGLDCILSSSTTFSAIYAKKDILTVYVAKIMDQKL